MLLAWLFRAPARAARTATGPRRVGGGTAAGADPARRTPAWRSSPTRRAEALEARIDEREVEIDGLREQVVALSGGVARLQALLEQEREASKDKLALLDDARQRLADAFSALSADALQTNNQQFLDLARTQLEQYQVAARADLESRRRSSATWSRRSASRSDKVDEQIQQLESVRVGAYASLTQQVRQLRTTQQALRARDRQPGQRAAPADRPRPLGRDPAASAWSSSRGMLELLRLR